MLCYGVSLSHAKKSNNHFFIVKLGLLMYLTKTQIMQSRDTSSSARLVSPPKSQDLFAAISVLDNCTVLDFGAS